MVLDPYGLKVIWGFKHANPLFHIDPFCQQAWLCVWKRPRIWSIFMKNNHPCQAVLFRVMGIFVLWRNRSDLDRRCPREKIGSRPVTVSSRPSLSRTIECRTSTIKALTRLSLTFVEVFLLSRWRAFHQFWLVQHSSVGGARDLT